MSEFREILVAVDRSKHSKNVVDYACDLAKKLFSKIVIAYVSPFTDISEDYIEYSRIKRIDLAEYYKAVGEVVLSKLVERVTQEGLPCENVLKVGNPAVEILSIAREKKVGMVVVGMKGLHGASRMRALGSVARRIVENSPCPVVVVPTPPTSKQR